MNFPVYEITDGDLTFISLVEFPAVETDFMCFSKEKGVVIPMSFDDGKREITGVAMIADKPIYRYNASMGEFYVTFPKDVIKKMAIKFFKHHKNSEVNVEHSQTVEGVTIMESYFINHERGIVPNEFADLSDGSWIVTYKVENEDVYQKIKSGDLRGFSIQGDFRYNNEPIETVSNNEVEDEDDDEFEIFIDSLI